jgi:hypothetical protein
LDIKSKDLDPDLFQKCSVSFSLLTILSGFQPQMRRRRGPKSRLLENSEEHALQEDSEENALKENSSPLRENSTSPLKESSTSETSAGIPLKENSSGVSCSLVKETKTGESNSNSNSKNSSSSSVKEITFEHSLLDEYHSLGALRQKLQRQQGGGGGERAGPPRVSSRLPASQSGGRSGTTTPPEKKSSLQEALMRLGKFISVQSPPPPFYVVLIFVICIFVFSEPQSI